MNILPTPTGSVLALCFFAAAVAIPTVAPADDIRSIGANTPLAMNLNANCIQVTRITGPSAPNSACGLSAANSGEYGFCGQCSDDEDCGVGHKCCGPEKCRECVKADTCPTTPASSRVDAILPDSETWGAPSPATTSRTSTVALNSNGNWGFATTDRKGNKYLFGPYSGKAECFQYRNNEALKLKWVVVSGCEPQFPADDYPYCKSGCIRSE